MNLLTGQKIEREDLKPGDHIYAWRTLYIYAHHGIYIGDDKVIHFTEPNGQKCVAGYVVKSISPSLGCPKCGALKNKTNNGVTVSCLDCFLDGRELYRYEYSVSRKLFYKSRNRTCSVAKSDPPDIVVGRATACIEEGFGEYKLIGNNCEDFALYCKTGNVKARKSFDFTHIRFAYNTK
ncbi:protein LEAD-SENSITIVE 1-like [Magnolia sinica]|uniref:protein LEAD-SENSITIVE 1-like n=1 Tax=Magnolia sinica TaxID=86752 RepID=UPI002658BF38|nr:protein LEAD-SENSITIVE 1-like [Magnolia sinica]